ncbi:flagellar basal body rod protein [Terrilactibacillus sp. BCM23-1]|uniref:Flagellar basal body rod protein n=1 Tax=Terrilactibacillus tamarindi TaxID=2599694 RepID=A0A6N8CWV0_9BACI|nr:flagellar basal body rod protein [Terrilactibacillus tamarindi]MTT33256.1 flagellar basal body rod protein [Terrilactibacillus tamarindi]
MKKFFLFLIGAVSLIILLANIGPLIGLTISLAIVYFSYRFFQKSESTFGKVAWFIIGGIAATTAIANIPSLIGILALVVLYFIYKKWNNDKPSDQESDDPFDHFEKQWMELK